MKRNFKESVQTRKGILEQIKKNIKDAKTVFKLFVAMLNRKLPTKFQLNIFIFEARASLQTLIQSLKQKDRKSSKVSNAPK